MCKPTTYKLRGAWLWEIGVKVKDYGKYFTDHPSSNNRQELSKGWNERNSQELHGL